MITTKEYSQLPKEHATRKFLHSIDVLKHYLKGMHKDTTTIFGNLDHRGDLVNKIHQLKNEISKHASLKDDFVKIRSKTYNPKKQYVVENDMQGDLIIDNYLAGSSLPFETHVKKYKQKPLLNIFMEISIPYEDRFGSFMKKRHEIIYKLVNQAMSVNQPVRVVAGRCMYYDDYNGPFTYYYIIKDYSEPIYPAIWASFKTNMSTWIFNQIWHNLVIGTNSYGNGNSKHWNIDVDMPVGQQLLLVNPIFATTIKGQIINEK